jgi:hypothetical protein
VFFTDESITVFYPSASPPTILQISASLVYSSSRGVFLTNPKLRKSWDMRPQETGIISRSSSALYTEEAIPISQQACLKSASNRSWMTLSEAAVMWVAVTLIFLD